MDSIAKSKSPRRNGAEPAWDIARLFPDQGCWDERDYLSLDTNHLVEFTDGAIDVLAMPKPAHQRIVLHLLDQVDGFVRPGKIGEVLMGPMPIRLRRGKFREPDVMFMLAAHSKRKGEDFWDRADLVMEVVSEDAESFERDHTTKRSDYAEAGIQEYWIVDPQVKMITVLNLRRGRYIVHGDFTTGQRATSVLLAGFSIDVNGVFAAAKSE